MIIEAVLNRLRGTGDVLRVGGFRVTGVMIYALYLMLVVTVITEWYYGLAFVVLFLIGESFAFGKWVGFLVDYEDEHTPEYDSKVGKKFPYIHYLAEAIVSEKIDYKKYCQVALAIRGIVWWLPTYMVLGVAGVISWTEAVVIGTLLGIGFPVACEIGREWKFKLNFGVLNCKQGWENQEIVYGLFQGLALWYVICSV